MDRVLESRPSRRDAEPSSVVQRKSRASFEGQDSCCLARVSRAQLSRAWREAEEAEDILESGRDQSMNKDDVLQFVTCGGPDHLSEWAWQRGGGFLYSARYDNNDRVLRHR